MDEDARIRFLRDLDKSSLPPDGRPNFNRLIFSGSPYLLQHAENPVDWYPWGEEAFQEARSSNKPVFLSIGYATCHWCHVMARESFENREVAEMINHYFVPIKVDREERPDIDEQYMAAAQLMQQRGGWPLNIVMTPERKPFFAATYLPPFSRQGMPGITNVLEHLARSWRTQRAEIEKQGATVVEYLRKMAAAQTGEIYGDDLSLRAFKDIEAIYDETAAGFGEETKFPMPLYLLFLLAYAKRRGAAEPLAMVKQTLSLMRQGGIYDQLGYGFHRYSVDRYWKVPHFEKMLYDQALLALTYLEAFQVTSDVSFKRVAEEIFAYGEREMAAPEGGFYAALDADSEGREGIYYLWTKEEVETTLGAAAAGIFFRLFGMTEEGVLEGRHVLSLPVSLAEFAARENLTPAAVEEALASWRELLLAARGKRIRPLRDEKVLTAWNGLMIVALARAYGVTGRDEYRASAARAVSFIREKLTTLEGRLQRVIYPDGSSFPGLLEDYAFFSWGLIELYENTLDKEYLRAALAYTREMLNLFSDRDAGGFLESGADAEFVLVRMKGGNDGVIPAGNSIAVMNLLRLGHITRDSNLLEAGEAALRACMGNVKSHPLGHIALLSAWDFLKGPRVEINLAGDVGAAKGNGMLAVLGKRHIPGLVVRHVQADKDFPEIDGKTTAYICAAGACRPPVTNPQDLAILLDELGL